MEIDEVQTILREEGFKVSSGTIPMNGKNAPTVSIKVELEGRSESEALDLEMLIVPGLDGELEGCRILQFFVTLSDTIEDFPEEKKKLLSTLISDLNFNLPLGAFGVRKQGEALFYKHMVMLPPEMTYNTQLALGETAWLIVFILNQCYPQFENVLGPA